MGEKYSPKVGDRVRVVLEGEVTDTAGGSVTISDRALRGSDPDFWCSSTVADDAKFLVSVEKVEPPVEFFKPGDVVRRRVSRYKPGLQFLIVDSGWVSFGGGWASGDGVYIEDRGRRFTSDEYEKVNLG